MVGVEMEKKIMLLVGLIIIVFFIGCSYYAFYPIKKEDRDDKIGVIVTILPEAEFVEKVGGDKVKVTTIVPPGADPHTYEPLPSQLIQVSKAKMYAEVGSGIEFELAWMDKIKDMNRKMLVINCSEGIKLISAREENINGNDPHVWVSPKNAKIMVENIYKGLIQIDPENNKYYATNKEKYLQELDKLDIEIRKTLSEKKNRKIMVYHPAWGYFCREYGLEQISIQKEGKEPTPQGIANLIKQAKEKNIKIIFVSPQYNTKNAEVIAREINGQVVIIDPLDKNYIENLYKVLEALQKA